MRSLRWMFVMVVAVLCCRCAPVQSAQPTATRTGPQVVVKQEEFLFTRLGGLDGIRAVVDDFVSRVAADERIKRFFVQIAADPAALADFKSKLVAQVCEVTGGPCVYKGKDMKKAHAGLGITSADFDALVADLAASLDAMKVKAKDRDELLGMLAPLKADIVETP
jgi:hemoglobin